MARPINTRKINKPEDEYLNSLGFMFGVRTPEVVLNPSGKFYLNIEVQPRTKMVIHERFIAGRGLGSLKVTSRKNTNAVVTELDFYNLYVDVGKVGAIPTSKYEYTITDIGGDVVSALSSFAYLGDENATTPARSASEISLPNITFERIIKNDTDDVFRFGFEFELVNTLNSVYQGYLELYFTEEVM